MKKLITICLMMAVPVLINAQTKEESISWIEQKLQKYMYFEYMGASAENVKIDINECYITINYSYVYYENGKKDITNGFSYKIPTDGVEFSDRIIKMRNGIESIEVREMSIGFSESATFGIRKGEDNLIERLNKAVAHLATFCPKKKETF